MQILSVSCYILMEFDDTGTVVEGFKDTPFGFSIFKKKLRGGFFVKNDFVFNLLSLPLHCFH